MTLDLADGAEADLDGDLLDRSWLEIGLRPGGARVLRPARRPTGC